MICRKAVNLQFYDMKKTNMRRAIASDAARLAACIDRAYESYTKSIDDLPAVSDGVEEDIANNAVWVVERNDKIVGGLILIFKPTYALLVNIAVDPCERGTGLGRALIVQAEEECRKLKIPKLKLSTHVKMPSNVKLYEHLGWNEMGRTESKIQMEKILDG